MKKHIGKTAMAVILQAAMMAGSILGCGMVGNAEEADDTYTGAVYEDVTGTVKIWIFGDYENKLVDEFNKMYPNVEVDFLLVDGSEFSKKLQTLISSEDYSELPDVVSLEAVTRGQLINLDIWEVLDAEPYNVNQEDLLDMIIPKVTNDKGELVCLPIDNSVGNVYYKRDLAEKYLGTSDPEELAERFQTWEDYYELATELSGKMDAEEYLMAGATELLIPMMNQVKDAAVQDEKFVAQEEYQEIIAFANKMQKTGVMGQMEVDSSAYWASTELNNVLFYPAAAWFVPDIIQQGSDELRGNWGVIPAPDGGFNIGGTACAIPSTSENKEAAFAWLHYLSLTMEGSAAWRDINNVMNCNKEAFETDGFYDSENEWFGDQSVGAVQQQSAKDTPGAMPLTKYDSAIRNALIQASVKIMNEDVADEEVYEVFLNNLYSTVPELEP